MTQGDVDSPIIFYIIIDTVLRVWKQHVAELKSNSKFYAYDRLLQNSNPIQLRTYLDYLINVFKSVGLCANEKKTKFTIIRGAAAPKALSAAAHSHFNARRERIPLTSTHRQQRNNIITCDTCHKQLKEISLL